MLMAQQTPHRHSSSSRQLLNKPSQNQRLPKLHNRSPFDNRPQNQEDFNHRTSPLRKSRSMALVLHGDSSTPSTYYIDQLQRFKRNHDIKNKEERQKQKEIMLQKLQQRRSLQMQRQDSNRKKQEQHLRTMIQKNTLLLNAHKQGLIRNNTYSTSIPVNPITLKYEPNLRGQFQKQADNRAQVRKLVRGHHLQTMGTSGYNIVNGATIDHTSKLVEKNKQIEGLYEDRLGRFYESLKIRPPSLEESPRKPFKYH